MRASRRIVRAAVSVRGGTGVDFGCGSVAGDDGKMWNLSSHTYDENAAREIYHEVKERHAAVLESLNHTMNDWVRDTESKIP